MQEAINHAKELIDCQNEVDSKELERHMDRLKPDINNLLHMYLPEEITVKESEILAMLINEIIWNPRRFLDAK
ncbi:MAG: hypothetical protein WC055_02175 [Melioribacteraceae bacterium]